MKSLSNWMEWSTHIHKQKLRDITLPATHDSGAYNLSDKLTNKPSKELQIIMNKGKEVADKLERIPGIEGLIGNTFNWVHDNIISSIRALAETTRRSIRQQLNDGIRCFDLRVAYDKDTKQYHVYHSLLGTEFSKIFHEFSNFLAQNKGEILYITFGHWNGFTEESQYRKFNKKITDALGKYAYRRTEDGENNPFDATYTEIINQFRTSSKVILVNKNPMVLHDNPIFWPKSYSPADNNRKGKVISGYYTDTMLAKKMLSEQKAQFTKNDDKLPFALYYTLTPADNESIAIVLANLAKDILNLPKVSIPVISSIFSSVTDIFTAPLKALVKEVLDFHWDGSWTTLEELCDPINDSMRNNLRTKFQPIACKQNKISMIYCDFYEKTPLVEIAIRYSDKSKNALYQLFYSENMKQGPSAQAWLVGDIDGDGKDEIVQQWDNGRLASIVYGWNGTKVKTLWDTKNMGQGPSAQAWLIGDINGDGKDEIIQQWKNGSRLATIVYGWSSSKMRTLWESKNMGQGARAEAWLIADVNGDGKDEIIQPWRNGRRLGLIVYGWKSSKMKTIWDTNNMKQGPSAIAWLVGDINGDGKDEIIQQWSNGSRLGTIVYGWDRSKIRTIWSNENMKQGPSAIKWLVGDINGDGKDEIIQLWNNRGRLSIIVYGWSRSSVRTLWSTNDIGQGPSADSWLIADVNGDGKEEIIQQWNNNGILATIVYGWSGSRLKTLWSTYDMGQGPSATKWLTADLDGNGKKDIIQQWRNGRKLGTIVYGR